MAYGTYYQRNIPNQIKSIMARMNAGLNGYEAPTEIGDNFLSEMWGVEQGWDYSMIMGSPTANTLIGSNMTGSNAVLCGISDQIADGSKHLVLLTFNANAGSDVYLNNFVDLNISTNAKTTVDISTLGLRWDGFASMTIFFTEAKRFVCFATSGNKKLLYYDYTSTPKLVSLPFYPKQICTYANRIFAIDTYNKLWWCRGGDFYTWYGVETDDDLLVTEVDMQTTAYTLTGSPIDVPRPWMATITTQGTADTLGNMVVVGTDALGAAQTETVALYSGVNTSLKNWKTITSFTTAGWVASVDTPRDHIKIGVGAVGGYVQEDAGYWTIERERTLNGIAVVGENLYIWSDVNIYIFQGYSPDTFSLEMIVSGIGTKTNIAVSGNTAYFAFANDIYEFDGQSSPRIINRPIYSNNQVINAVYGGVARAETIHSKGLYTYADLWNVAADNERLYYYEQWMGNVSGNIRQMDFYIFEIKNRSWWKVAGFSRDHDPSTDSMYALYIPQSDKNGFYNVMHSYHGDDDPTWGIYTYKGIASIRHPYFVTKAFNEGVSDTETLTAIIIKLRSYDAEFSDPSLVKLYVSYSLTADGTGDFTLLKTFTGDEIPYDTGLLEINLIGSEICKAKHYRLKFTFESAGEEIYLYGIERRYRVLGRSR